MWDCGLLFTHKTQMFVIYTQPSNVGYLHTTLKYVYLNTTLKYGFLNTTFKCWLSTHNT